MNKIIIDYDIVKEYDKIELRDSVKQMIDDGWQPFKSLIIYGENGSTVYFQTVVKYAGDDDSM